MYNSVLHLELSTPRCYSTFVFSRLFVCRVDGKLYSCFLVCLCAGLMGNYIPNVERATEIATEFGKFGTLRSLLSLVSLVH